MNAISRVNDARGMLMRWFLAVVSIGIMAAPGKGTSHMDETLRNLVRRSDVVVVATMHRASIVNAEGTEVLRAETEVREVLKGNAPPGGVLVVNIRTAGKETPNLEAERDYVLFLKPLGKGPGTLVPGMRPLGVPAKDTEKFLRCLRQAIALYERNPSDRELKEQVFEMLASGVTFFEQDATQLAAEIPEWTAAEIDRLIAFLTSPFGQSAITGDERTNVEAVVAMFADAPRIAMFARAEYRLHAGDGIYYGFLERKNASPNVVLADLLSDPDDQIKIGALRLAGLLRRGDIIDAFEKKSAGTSDKAVRSAIASARALVTRDF